MSARHSILIADDHVVVAASLGALLDRWFDVVSIVGQLDDIVPEAGRLHPDAAVLDYSFGSAGNCIPVIPPLLAAVPTCRVVVLTAHDSAALAETAVAAGASSFVSKTASPEELRLAIELALRRGAVASTSRRSTAPIWHEPRASRRDSPVVGPGPCGLTAREASVLLHIYSGQKQADIATELGVAAKTVEYYRHTAGKRLGITRLPLLLRWVGEHRVELEKMVEVLPH